MLTLRIGGGAAARSPLVRSPKRKPPAGWASQKAVSWSNRARSSAGAAMGPGSRSFPVMTRPPWGTVMATRSAPSGVLPFRLPQGAQATIDGVPIGLSDGLGIHALAPGSHRVVLHVSGKETAHTVNVRSHKIFTVTPAGIVATEP